MESVGMGQVQMKKEWRLRRDVVDIQIEANADDVEAGHGVNIIYLRISTRREGVSVIDFLLFFFSLFFSACIRPLSMSSRQQKILLRGSFRCFFT